MPELRSRVPNAIQAAVASVSRPLYLCVANFSCFPAIANVGAIPQTWNVFPYVHLGPSLTSASDRELGPEEGILHS